MQNFPPFRLDTVNECLWRSRDDGEDERIHLTPKAFAVLRYLIENAGRLVNQNELLDTLWPDVYVQPEVLKSHIRDLRRALGDDPKHPRFIETFPRRGYEFIAPLKDVSTELTGLEQPSRKLVGRNAALDHLSRSLQTALRGQRQMVFVSGEPGIGKTALADEFLWRAAADSPDVRVARGQCVEGYGGKEAYYPILEALSQLCGKSGGDFVVQTLAAQAPTWLAQFPALVKSKQREMLQREILGATRERMLREIGEALETISSERPLLLVLEDVHWADHSTVDLISSLARRRAPAKLMLIGTYRPVDATLSKHPFKTVKQDLLVHKLSREIALEPLSEAEVAEYLAIESRGFAVPEGLAGLLYRHTEGNPLFMVAAFGDMWDRGLIALENGVWQMRVPLEKIDLEAPESLRQMIELQIERLSAEEQRALEVMSVLRRSSLSVAVGSAVANIDPERFEELLEGLARRHQVIRRAGFRSYQNSPAPSPCYEFVHVLYRDVLYSRIGPARRRKLHKCMGETGEALHVVPGEGLAYQFEKGGDWPRAVKYLLSAADTEGRRFEPRQAAAILKHALELVNRIPEAERAQTEIDVLHRLAKIYWASYDPRTVDTYEALAVRAARNGMVEVELRALLDMTVPLAVLSSADLYQRALDRALEAQLRLGEGDPLIRAAMRALYLSRRMGSGRSDAREMKECKNLIARLRDTGQRRILGEVQFGLGYSLRNFSEYREALRCAEEGFAILLEGCEENPYLNFNFKMYEDLVVTCCLFLGEWGEALRKVEERIEIVEKNGDGKSAIFMGIDRAQLQIYAMDFTGAQQFLESALPVVAPIPTFRRDCLILAGSAEAGLGNHERALEYLLTCRDEMDQRALMNDWYNRMPLQWALTEIWLSQGELEKARVEAKHFLKVTLATEERTFRALAFEANARVAIAEGNLDRAQDCIDRAVQEMEGFEVPLAGWRVDATASEIYERMGEQDLAEKHRDLSRATIMKLTNSLFAEETLRKTFLSAPVILKILRETEDPRSHGKETAPCTPEFQL